MPDRDIHTSVESARRTLIATLPNGRVAWLQIEPKLALADEVNHLQEVVTRARARRQAALGSQRRILRFQRAAIRADLDNLTRTRLVGRRKLWRRLVEGHARVDRRLSRAFDQLHAERERIHARERTMALRLARQRVLDRLLILTSVPLFAAFGQRGSPFAPNNLALSLLLLVWLIGDDVVDLLSSRRRRSQSPIREVDVWSYLAPLANLLTGWLLMRRHQHERLITGVAAAFDPPTSTFGAVVGGSRERRFHYTQAVDLTALVAPGHVEDFITFANVPAVATISSLEWAPGLPAAASPRVLDLTAIVDRGTLTIEVLAVALEPAAGPPPGGDLPSIIQALAVAWIVDTKGA